MPGNKTIQKNKQNHNPRSDPQTNAQKSWFGQKSNVGENPMTNGPAWIASFGSRPQRFVNVVVHVQVAQLKPWVIFVGARASLRDCKSRSTFRSQLPHHSRHHLLHCPQNRTLSHRQARQMKTKPSFGMVGHSGPCHHQMQCQHHQILNFLMVGGKASAEQSWGGSCRGEPAAEQIWGDSLRLRSMYFQVRDVRLMYV